MAQPVKSPSVLERCIAPLSIARFFESYWEKKPLVLHRDAPNLFSDLFSLGAMDQIIADTNLSQSLPRQAGAYSSITLNRSAGCNKSEIDSNNLSTDSGSIFDKLSDETAITVESLELSWPPVGRFCNGLEHEIPYLIRSVQAEAHLTPRSAKGFESRDNARDLLILQVQGALRWKIWADQTQSRQVDDTHNPAAGSHSEKSPFADFTLSPGDTIYIPRGFSFAVQPQNSTSLHLVIGFVCSRLSDLLRALSAEAIRQLQDELLLRKAVPDQMFDDGPSDAAAVEFDNLRDKFFSNFDLRKGYHLMKHGPASMRRQHPRGHLLDLLRYKEIKPSTEIFPRRSLTMRRQLDNDEGVEVFLNERLLKFPLLFTGALEHILSVEVFRYPELPGLSLDDSLRLAKELIRSGFVTLDAKFSDA